MNPENPAGTPGRGWTDRNWLVSRCHVGDAGAAAGASPRGGEGGRGCRSGGFGPLRQLDLQLVQPMRGFGTHCDLDMEVLTYVVEGRLAHRDATGREATLLPGGIQCVTGGTGAYHSEFNPAHAGRGGGGGGRRPAPGGPALTRGRALRREPPGGHPARLQRVRVRPRGRRPRADRSARGAPGLHG